MLATKYRMYPNKEQTKKLEFALDTCRQAYNMMLGELNNQIIIDRNMIQAMLPDLKICEPRFREVYSKTLQYECYKLFSNLSALKVLKGNHKKVGRLRFKGKGWFKTINYNQSGFSLENNKLHLSKIGNIKIKVHRDVNGNIKQIQIKKGIDRWYAIIITDEKKQIFCGNRIIGIDLGINNYLVDSKGNKTENPKILEQNLSKLKHLNKELSRKKKGSNNRKKARKRLSKLHLKITNQRTDFLHKITTNLVKECKTIVMEDLNIKQMSQQKYFNAKNRVDASWGKFTQLLNFKAESAGCQIVKVNPRNTSKTCSQCGRIQDMPLYKRTYECAECGFVIDRDYNSAINILNKLAGQELSGVEKSTSVPLEQVGSMKQEALSLEVG
ncbi:transposase [archaeon CG10_big_fil_rev_8_21_14_0_10_43_11]|nr:MAG: transposase [archaeon CG10_big_fil_rev_8_21_14_0_10_43_11]